MAALLELTDRLHRAENLGDTYEAALDAIVTRIGEAADAGAQIICTQELFRSPYFCQAENPVNFRLAETIPGPTTTA